MRATVTAREAAMTRIKSPARTTPRAQAWAKLMARVGEEFLLECPNGGGDIRLIAFRLLGDKKVSGTLFGTHGLGFLWRKGS